MPVSQAREVALVIRDQKSLDRRVAGSIGSPRVGRRGGQPTWQVGGLGSDGTVAWYRDLGRMFISTDILIVVTGSGAAREITVDSRGDYRRHTSDQFEKRHSSLSTGTAGSRII
jgi:hypothetical protein